MTRYLRRGAGILLTTLIVLLINGPALTSQLDYEDSERIDYQEWTMEFTIRSEGLDNFSIRLPFPNYTYKGEWAEYSTDQVIVHAYSDQGPIIYQLHHYNEGYSNQGVWLQIVYPCYYNTVSITVRQSAKIDLPGLNYPLTLHVNNPWMYGTDIIDITSSVISDVLSEALLLDGDWHTGNRSVPEKIVNWMNLNMTWSDSPSAYEKPASQVLTERTGNCDEWAHATCALLIKAGIAAKVVLSGTIPTINSTPYKFPTAALHLSTAYWDGKGWVLIDPQISSGFTTINRVILGADQDEQGIEIRYDPDYLKYSVSNVAYSSGSGNYSGHLYYCGSRSSACSSDILEHYENTPVQPSQGTEPIHNIIPNIVTDAQHADMIPGMPRIINYPNPFNPATTFSLEIAVPGIVDIDLYSVDGRHITSIFTGYVEKGQKQITWKSVGLQSGIYFARMQSPEGSTTCKVIILR